MNENDQKLVKSIINSLSNRLKSLVNDFIIDKSKAFVTLKANDSKDAATLEGARKEIEEILKKSGYFDEVYVSFVEKEKLFDNVIAISSCKGGVGKSTIAVNIALSLTRLGYEVGILDADIYGPSVPNLLNISDKPDVDEKKKIIPIIKERLKIMSMGLLIDEEKPIVWRGPMIQNALTQLVDEVKWGKLDYLVVDLPPGTGDAYLAILQKLKITKSVIVTTSQSLAIADTQKGINLMLKFNVPITGIIENMSYFKCKNCSQNNYIFGKTGTEELAKKFNTKVIAKIPIFSDAEKNVNQSKEKLYDNLVGKLLS